LQNRVNLLQVGLFLSSCHQFKNQLDWVYGGFSNGMTQFVNVTDQWTISNLRWPRYDLNTNLPFAFEIAIYDLVSGKYQIQRKMRYDPFYSPSKQPFTKTNLNVDKKHRKETDVTYTFTFACTNDIPSGGSLTLSLPSSYNLIASFPPVKITYPEFEDASATLKLTHYYTAFKVTINNIGTVYRGTEFRIIISGMRNPDISSAMNTFSVGTFLNGFAVNQANNFVSVTLEPPHTPGLINVNSISLFPINRLATSDYTFAFNPQTKLSVGAEIHIVFPSEYLSLPLNPTCFVSGGLTTFELCYKLANEIIMRLDSTYYTDVIFIKVQGISNPNVAMTSSFSIYTTYDGGTIDQTSAGSAASRKITLSAKACKHF
jgi:hypothetical protein